jgi:hypothetical protein
LRRCSAPKGEPSLACVALGVRWRP